MTAEAESLLAPMSPTTPGHTRAPSSTSTAEIIESVPCCCQGYCQQPSTSATATLQSNTSESWSSYSAQQHRSCCHSCEHTLSECPVATESFSFVPAPHSDDNPNTEASDLVTLRANAYGSEDEDSVLRYSFKGIPPELYSAKKDFIYRRPLVEKQE